MGFELNLAAIRSAAKNRKPCTGYAATAATAATAPSQSVATVASVASVASSHRAATPPKPPKSVASVATVASSHGLKAASFPPAPAPGPQGLDPGHDALLAMAMKFCDATHASDKEREDWQRDVLETPPELRQGLYNYLREQLRPSNLLWRNQK